MKKVLAYPFLFLICLFLMVRTIQASDHIPLSGESFPDVFITAPEKLSDMDYLGLTGTRSFKVSQIKGDLVILEIFSMYCPYCQKEAPIVNELYQLVNKDASLKSRVKFIGVGAGNTLFEVNLFRDEYHVQFPLVPDENFAVHKAAGGVRTPYFFVIRLNPDGSNKIIYSKVGSIQDAGKFLEAILNDAGGK